jgi:hypothetical protein
MPTIETGRYDPVTAAILGGWGPARSFLGLIAALAFGYLLVGYRSIFGEYAAGIPSRAGWIAFTGPLWFVTIPFVSYCLFRGVVREACQPITLLHLAALQGLNVSLSYGSRISIPLCVFGLSVIAFDFYILARLRISAASAPPLAVATRPTRFLIFTFGTIQMFFIVHFGWTKVQFITPSLAETFYRMLAFSIPAVSCAALAALALTAEFIRKNEN